MSEARFAPGRNDCPLMPAKVPAYHSKGPLGPDLAPEVRKSAQDYLAFLKENDYSPENFGQAAKKGRILLEEAKGWKEASRALRKLSLESQGEHFERLHGDFFEGLVHPDLLAKARSNAIWGVSARSECDAHTRVRSNPHPSLREHLDEAGAQLWKDAQKGRALITEDRGGDLLDGVVSVPMARVPKRLPDRTLSDKGRVIWDATPVNKTCAKENHPPALQPRHSEVARCILWWKQRFPFARILLSKKDVSDAFKWIPVRLDDTRLFAADLPGPHFGLPCSLTVVYNTLTFGWTGAPGEFMLYAWVAKLAHLSHCPQEEDWHDRVAFRSLVLMDDTVLIEPEIGVRPWMSARAAEECVRATLGPGTLNQEKDAVEGALEERKLIWGLLYDTARGTRSLPPAKLEKASYLLHLPEFDYGNTRIPLKLVQELRGNQQFWITVLPTIANFLQASNELLGPPDKEGFVVPRGCPLRQKRTWVRFWEAIELQRLLVDNRGAWASRFTHPMTEALDVAESMAYCTENIVWASGDATLDYVAAVDWDAKQAFAEPVRDFEGLIKEFMADACNESSPGDDEPEDSGFIISITELLAVVALASLRATGWNGKLVLYGGDNQNVIRWLDKRQAKHPVANYLLQVLSAVEATHSFRVHGAYIRTYHNVTADDLTRGDPKPVMEQRGLTTLPGASEALGRFLERGWLRRALIWAGQADADRCQALRLADRRSDDTHPLMVQPDHALGLKVLEIGGSLERYAPALVSLGAESMGIFELDKAREAFGNLENVDGTVLLALSLPPDLNVVSELGRGVIHARPRLVWADSQMERPCKVFSEALKRQGYRVSVMQVSGRTLRDQVWWRRWVTLGDLLATPSQPCLDAREEPQTEIPAYYDCTWFEGGEVETLCAGRLHLDPLMPYLGPDKPKPCGHLITKEGGERKLVWSPTKPLPSLHAGSWDSEHPESLLLHVAGKQGPVARTLLPKEAVLLLHGRASTSGGESSEEAAKALIAAPRKLAELASQWAAGAVSGESPEGPKSKVGLCRLRWEDETERVLYAWIKDNPPLPLAPVGRVGGGKGRRGKGREDKPPIFYASKTISRLLRHEGGREDLPMSHEGWVKWQDLMTHSKLRGYSRQVLYDALMINDKERFTAVPDREGQWWVAAWSGHTIPGCVGPSRAVPGGEVPPILVHGTYKRLVPHIEAEGLRALKRDIHLQDPQAHARRWRKGLEIKVTVDTVRAIELGCRFRVTGNLVWLCSQTIPVDAITSFTEWDDLQGGRRAQVVGDVGSGRDKDGIWEPDEEEWHLQEAVGGNEPTVTDQIVETARDLAPAVATFDGKGSVLMCADTWEVEVKDQPEARSSPGIGGEDEAEECDWSEDENPAADPVEATPARTSSSTVKVEPEGGEDVKMEAKTELGEETGAPVPNRPAGSKETPKGEIQEDAGGPDKSVVEEDQPKKRKILRFGSSQIKLLRAIAEADSANWNSLQQCIQSHEAATPGEKTELVEHLEQLAEERAKGREGALRALEEHQRKAVEVSELESQYRQGLSVEMERLERYNPVGPRAAQPLLTLNRLQADIDAGTGIWQARRAQRSGERAAKHRLTMQGAEGAPRGEAAGTLHEVPTEAHGDVIDMTMADRAKEEVRNFKKELREAEQVRREGIKRHQKDSQRRKQLKREKAKEKKRARKGCDDAERDSNHAIAHSVGIFLESTEASFSPGQSSLNPLWFLAALLLFGVAKLVWALNGSLWTRGVSLERAEEDRRVGARKRRVRFANPKSPRGKGAVAPVPFLGGPKTAKRLHPPDKPLRFTEVQGSAEWEQEVLSLLMDRYSKTTTQVYQSQFKWWELFCLRRNIDPIRIYRGGYDRAEEQLFLDYIVHSSTNAQARSN